MKMEMSPPTWSVYILRCADGSLYTGIALDVEKRLAQHNAGKGAKYTRARLPAMLTAWSSNRSRSDALKLEYYIKQQQKEDKVTKLREANCSEDWRRSEKSGCCNRPVGKGGMRG